MPKKILLIESDTALTGSLTAALQARGALVAHARDAGSAIDVARLERPDGIVLCAELPGGSGFVVCNKLRKDPELRAIPLLLTSAASTEETFEQHRKLKTRADVYLRKPFTASALLDTLAPLAGLPEPSPSAPDDDDLVAFEAAFDSIAQVEEASAPIDHPISSDEVEAAAALVADVPDIVVEPPPPPSPRAEAVPVPRPAAAAVSAGGELEALRPEVERLRSELKRLQAELDAANAARAELASRLDAEQARVHEAVAQGKEELTATRERIRSALTAALAEVDRS